MAAISKGDKAHIFGVQGTITNARIQNFSWKRDFANKATVENESGNIVEERMDDEQHEASMELVLEPEFENRVLGSSLETHDIVFYITSIDQKEANKEFLKLTISLRKTQYVNLTAGA